MFIGHFGVGFGAKSLAPRVSLGTLFLAAQFVDLLWPTLLLLGVERVRIEPGASAASPLIFEHYPFSHSLVAVAVWAALFGGAYYLLHRDRRAAIVVAALLVSHWMLDLVVHRPDLPILPNGGPLVGLGAWSSLPLTMLIELPLFGLGVWLYARCTVPRDPTGKWALWALVAFFLVVYVASLFGSPPPGVRAIAWVGQAQWLMVLWAYWVDRHRRVRVAGRPARESLAS